MSPRPRQTPPRLSILFANSIQMFAGGEIWMLRTMEALRARGHRVGLVCRPHTELAARSNDSGFLTYTQTFRGDFDPVTIARFAGAVRRFRPDVILTNMDKELRVAGVVTRFYPHIVLLPRRGIDYPLKNHLVYRLTYQKWADGIVANSLATKRSLLRNAPWLSPEKIRVIYNGVDVRLFYGRSDSWRRKLNLPGEAFVFGFSGQLDQRKGIQFLLPAFAELVRSRSDCFLLMAGEGKMRAEIEDFLEKRNLKNHIFLLGFVDDVPEFMANIDALVLPSLWEGFGIVLIEAMAAGKPVISTRASNLPEIVKDEVNGFLVQPGNYSELCDAMEKLAADRKLAAALGQHGRSMVEQRFTLEKVTQELENYSWRLVRKKRKLN